MKLLLRCLAPRAAVCLICRKPTSLLGRWCIDLSEVELVTRVVACRTVGNRPHRWGSRAFAEVGLAVGAVVLDGGLYCPWSGGVFELPEADLAAGVVARCFVGCRLCRRGNCGSLGMPRSCDEGLEL
ncbi:hypothetical protein CDL15_Pgr008678 [Punica granatum]|uniref:Uncharacterized protein n=1 Tax=Punica granatum TaxID=22663 RepID=A0A218XCX2_PUNGR|nr:hypothetical protein CDL15_Pgr008678 [Punica granatum]